MEARSMMCRRLLFFASLFLYMSLLSCGAVEQGEKLIWGTNALRLSAECRRQPTLDELLDGRVNTVTLKNFYRAGGENAPVAPTECRIAHDADNLFVVFRCFLIEMSFCCPMKPCQTPSDWV